MSSTRARAPRQPWRLLRGAVVGLVGSTVAVVGHLVGGGTSVAPVAWAAVALLLLGAVAASGRRWTRSRLVAALALMQVVIHAALWLASPTGVLDPRIVGLSTTTHAAGHDHAVMSPAMLLAHAGAVLVAALVLAGLERCALALWSLAHAAALRTVAVVLPARGPAVLARRSAVRPSSLVVVGLRQRRGPPRALATR